MLRFLCAAHKHRINTITQSWVDHTMFCQAILAKGAVLANIFRFIDGTTVHICHPSTGQEEVFSGHKHYHVLKFQHVMMLNGIIVHSFGPFAVRCNDAVMYRDSGLDAELQRTLLNGQQLALFSDGGYVNRPWLQTPFRGQMGDEQCTFNAIMSSVQILVEWGFAKIKMLFTFTNFNCNQKLFLQLLANYFTVATLIANCHTSLYSSEISQYFAVKPLTLDEYLAWNTLLPIAGITAWQEHRILSAIFETCEQQTTNNKQHTSLEHLYLPLILWDVTAQLCPIDVNGTVAILFTFCTVFTSRHMSTSFLCVKAFFLQSQLPHFDVKLVHFTKMFEMCSFLHCFCELCKVLKGSHTVVIVLRSIRRQSYAMLQKVQLFLFKFAICIFNVMPAKQWGYEVFLT